jgi:hypothetical protein
MAVLVTLETLILALLALLVAGLLRSHAEILRRLAEVERSEPRLAPGVVSAGDGTTHASDVAGETGTGEAVKIAVAGVRHSTLLAFLTTGCGSCGELWRGLRDGASIRLPGGPRLVAVTKDRSQESPSRLAELGPRGVPVVMSSAAWEAYGVKGSPYFVLVDGPSGTVLGEGSALGWEHVGSLLRDALADADVAARVRGRFLGTASSGDGSAGRIRRADQELAAAGIGPAHPSMYGPPGIRGTEGERDGG